MSWKWSVESLGKECHYCVRAASTRDHIVPRSLGGTDGLYNLVPACRECNEAKEDQWPTCECARCEKAVVRWMLNPTREDKWDRIAGWRAYNN